MSSSDDANEQWKRNVARFEQQIDQRYAEFRTEYQSLEPEEKQRLYKWISDLAAVGELDLPTLPSMVRLVIAVGRGQKPPDEFDYPPASLKKAIEAWERGEDYPPRLIGDS